jgi:hypothetical protein
MYPESFRKFRRAVLEKPGKEEGPFKDIEEKDSKEVKL